MTKPKEHPLTPVVASSPSMIEHLTTVIDGLAIQVRRIPSYPMPPEIKARVRIIASELLRRAK